MSHLPIKMLHDTNIVKQELTFSEHCQKLMRWKKEQLRGRAVRKTKSCLPFGEMRVICFLGERAYIFTYCLTVQGLIRILVLKYFQGCRLIQESDKSYRMSLQKQTKNLYCTLNVCIQFLGYWLLRPIFWVYSVHGPRVVILRMSTHSMTFESKLSVVSSKIHTLYTSKGFPGVSDHKASACNAKDLDSIPG